MRGGAPSSPFETLVAFSPQRHHQGDVWPNPGHGKKIDTANHSAARSDWRGPVKNASKSSRCDWATGDSMTSWVGEREEQHRCGSFVGYVRASPQW